MNLFTENMVIVGILVYLLGILIKPFFKKCSDKLRNVLMPLILMCIGSALLVFISYMDKSGHLGTAALQGLFSSVCCQFLYDKFKYVFKKES